MGGVGSIALKACVPSRDVTFCCTARSTEQLITLVMIVAIAWQGEKEQ